MKRKKFNARLIVDRESGKVKFYFPPAEETELICPFCNKSLKKYDWDMLAQIVPDAAFI